MSKGPSIPLKFRAFAAAAVVILASGCAHRRNQGTELEDNAETRAIRDILVAYINAVENRDANALLMLVSEKFADDAGTFEPEDDLTIETLRTALPERFKKLQDIHLELELRRVQVERDLAVATYYYTLRYRMPGLSDKPQLESDLKQMTFVREGDHWKILSGI